MKKNNIKKLLCIFAHPDDESFGPGGTIAKYAKDKNTKVYLLSATKGEAGQNATKKTKSLFKIREKELKEAAKILGIENVSFLKFLDGEICNHELNHLTEDILKHIKKIKPQVILTFDITGHYGHLDHIGVTLAVTRAFFKTSIPKKLYYHVLPKNFTEVFEKQGDRLFFGFPKEKITTSIDIKKFWQIKKEAMKKHKTQKKDWKLFLPIMEKLPKKEYFHLAQHRLKNLNLPETDLFDKIY